MQRVWTQFRYTYWNKKKKKNKNTEGNFELDRFKDNKSQKPINNYNPLIKAAKICYDENGPNCRLNGIEEKCKYCIKNKEGKDVNFISD